MKRYLFSAFCFLLSALSFAQDLSPATSISTRGLVGYWKMDYLVDTTKVWDASGGGNHGTLTGGLTPVAHLGQALSLNGTTEYMDVGDKLPIASGGITISLWVKYTTGNTNKTFISRRSVAAYDSCNYLVGTSGGNKLTFFYTLAPLSTYQVWESTSTDSVLGANNGLWHHLSISYTFGTGSSFVMRLDGVAVAGSWTFGDGNSLPYTEAGEHLTIGSTWTSAAVNFITGSIDDVRIYNRALSVGENSILYHQ